MFACKREKQPSSRSINDEQIPVITDTVLLKWQKNFANASNEIRFFIENRIPNQRYFLLDRELFSSVLIPRYYINNGFSPKWFNDRSLKQDQINEMIAYIEQLSFHGLTPEDYHLNQIKAIANEIKEGDYNTKDIANLDIFLSDAFLIISSHLYNGKVDPEAIQSEWGIQRGRPELMLDNKLSDMLADTLSIASYMEAFYPVGMGYKSMIRKAKDLIKYKASEVFLDIPADSLSSDHAINVVYRDVIVNRFQYLGYDSEELDTNNVDLSKRIAEFQTVHGLNANGKIGKNTYDAINKPVSDNLKKLYVNMERLRWLPISPSDTLVSINIADFTLVYRNGSDTLIKSRTVVGRDFRQTPIFESKIAYLVFAPTWTIPQTILKNDILPKVVKDSNYLKEHSMVVLDRSGNSVPSSTIDWKKALKGNFPYMIRQEPGPDNPLGKVKFMFPNKYSVYVHDTPSKSLFARDERTFSSGCIRMGAPRDLATLLLNDSIRWNKDVVNTFMNSNKETSVVLKKPVRVSIYYLTSWADASKNVNFRKDIYNRDDAIYKALQTQTR